MYNSHPSYLDQGNSFDQTLLYGHEMALQVFFLLFFTMVDLIGTNFVLAATLTFIMNEVRPHLQVDSLANSKINLSSYIVSLMNKYVVF